MSVTDYVKLQNDTHEKIDKAAVNFKKTPKARITITYLEARLELLDRYWSTFEANHHHILVLSEKQDDKYFKDDLYDTVEEKYIVYKSELKEALCQIQPQNQPAATNTQNHSNYNNHSESSAVKLPKIILPVFTGRYLEWPTFHDLFESLIHNNPSLADVQKLHYLKSHLSGEAEQLLRHIPITEANYEQCWTQLKKRYDNKRYIASCILNRLVGQKTLSTESSNGIKQILDTTSDCLNALTNMGIDISTWDILVIHLVTQKLDQESRKQWEQKISDYSDILPSYKELATFLESRFRALEFLEPQPKREISKDVKESRSTKVFSVINASVSCPFCSESHLMYQCKRFAQESIQSRRDFIKEKRLCFNCFGANHSATQCKRNTSCRRCGRRHHSLLHQDNVYPPTAQPGLAVAGERREVIHGDSEQGDAKTSNIATHFSKGSVMSMNEVMLATALVKVENKTNCYKFKALLDQGSQASFITEHAVQLLQLHKLPVNGSVSGLGGDKSLSIKYMVKFRIQSTCSSFSVVIQAYVLSRLTSTLPSQKIEIQGWPELTELVLADPGYGTPSNVDMLLGAEVYGQILTDGIVRHPLGTLTAQNTLLGWILSGRVQVSNHSDNIITTHILDNSMNDMLRKFWEIETDQPRTFLSKDDQACETYYASTTTRDDTGRYVVGLPFRDDDPSCQYGESRNVALRRFHMLEKRLERNPLLKQEYSKVMNEYVSMNHTELIHDQQEVNKPGCFYMPHFPVVREDKTTTKYRIVFDASCPGINGKSLNDDLLIGPRLQPELRHIILKWRVHPVCFVADIVKMYRQVKVIHEHTDFQRLLWRENSNEDIKDFRMLRVCFGVSSAPYLAVKSMQQVAIDEGKSYPLAADRVLSDFYMDDFMSGCENEDEALQIHSQTIGLLGKAGFELQKWTSNSQRLMKTIYPNPVTGTEKVIKMDDIIRILGLSWNYQSDSFHYRVNLPPQRTPITKRIILSDISRLFDPLGWIAPVIIRAKIFMQKLWLSGVTWDQDISSSHPGMLEEWNQFREELPALDEFVVPRWIGVRQDTTDASIHGFSDASNDAFAAVVYLRVVDSAGNISVTLLAARTRVSPVKQLSTPRLELSGAELLAKLMAEVATVLSIPMSRCRAWTDSTIVLAWLQGQPNRWTTFVANRVAEILSILNNDQWAHVVSSNNPADCASRGLSPRDFIQFQLWVHGPAWLHEPGYTHPTVEQRSTEVEAKPIKVHLSTALSTPEESAEFSVWTKYSSLTRTVRVVAYCLRFVRKVRHEALPSYLTARELDIALTLGIKASQASAFPRELSQLTQSKPIPRKSSILSLCPFLDDEGIMRTRGRIEQSDLAYNVKHPIIMPRDHHLSRLIISDAHAKTLHGGPQLTLNYVRAKFLIVNAKGLIRQILSKCVKCIRYKSSKNHPFMADLPSSRVTVARAFIRSGVDYAGPINVRMSKGRGCKSYKGYIALFVCMVTRSIHLEAVSSLTTEGFLAAFRRFVARRGPCREIWSDNGSNFVGAAKELRVLFQQGESCVIKEVAEALASEGTEWHFIPPRAPNFGGLWERGVASTKYHLKRVLDGTTLTFEELSTVLVQVEACLNSRPMYQLPSNQVDSNPLTPGHFLVGEALVTAPDRSYADSVISPLHRWQLTQKLMQQFWRKWSQEYLTTLYQRYKWTKSTPEPKVGDVVLVREDDLPPSKWLFGLIEEKHPGSDNVTRVVSLRCKNAKFVRPVSKLIILPVADYHITQTASWLPPVECWPGSRDGSRSSQEPDEEDLPYGWEQALDSRGKPYYINHVNKTTTYVAPEGCSCESPPAPRDVTLERHAELGFGFVAGSERPVLVRFVTDNSPSVGKLEPGDQILCVNGEDVSAAAREHVIAAVRACAERVTLRVCQPARAGNPARRSALLSAAKRARLRARPPRVRFADSVQLNGAPMYPPSAFSLGDLCLPPMANVLKVFLENGQTKSFKYSAGTAAADVVASLEDKLRLAAGEHFSLVVEHVKSVRRNKLTLLDPKESLARIASRPGSHKMRCLFRVVFMPASAAALAQRDLAALDYLYMQCCNDVAQERFSPELQPDVALRLAALHMHQHALANNLSPAKLTVKAVEREFGLERFVPSGLLESMKRKEIRRLIGHFLKLNSQMTGSQRQLTQLQAKLHYLDIVAGLPSYGAKCFGSTRPERVILVSPRFGLSQIISRANPGPQPIASLEEVEGVRVKREAAGSADVAIFLARDRVVALLMDERDAVEMPLVIAGYYRLATGKELNVELEREPITEDIAPPYLSQHNVVPMKWSYLNNDDPIVLTKKHFAIFTMPPPYHSTPDQAKASLDTNMNSSLTNKNHSNNSSPLIGYDSRQELLGHDVHFEKCKRNDEFKLFDPNDACYLDDGMGFDLQSVLSMELLENASNNPRLVEAKNEEVLRRVAEMQKLVENSEQYLTENSDVYNEDAFTNGMLRDELVGKETNVDQLESDTESNNSRMSTADDAPGILKHSDSLLLLTETINQGLSGLSIPETEKDINLTMRQSQGLSAILNNCGLTDALIALNNDLSHSESDNDSLYTPTNSPIRRHQKPTNKVVRTSFGLHSPDATLDNKEPNLKEYLKQLREKSSKEEVKADFPYFEETSVDNDAELIDLTLIPPPQTPDELDCATQVPQILPVVPPSFADEKKNSAENLSGPKKGDIEEFIANVTVQPPTVRVTPAIELTPEQIMSYIIPPPPGSNSSTLDREPVSYVNHSQIMEAKQQQNHKDAKPNGEVVKGTLSVSEIRNMFTAKTLSDARNSLLLKEKSKAQAQSKSDSPKTKRKNVTEKPANGTARVIEYPTVERRGVFSCCSKDKCKSDDSDESDKAGHVDKSDSMPDVCEIRPPPRRKNVEHMQPPERPPKIAPAPAPRPRSNSFTCPNHELSAVEIPTNPFSTLNNRRLNYKVVCEINDQMQPPILPPRLEPKVLAPPPPLLLPPKKPPLPPVPSIEVLRMKTSQKQSPLREQRLASIGSPHFQRNLNSYRNLENESRLDDDTHSLRSTPNYSSMTLQSRHVRSSSETKSTILKNNEMSTVLSLCSPQMHRRLSNRPDLLRGAEGHSPPTDRKFRASPTPKVQNHVRFRDDVADDIPAPPPPPLLPGANGAATAAAALAAGEAAAAALLARLHAAAQRAQHQHAHGGGEDIDENKFQRARSELTSCAVTLVGASRTLVGALGGSGPIAPALADCLTPLRRLADLAQALGRHTSSPLQTRNLILRVHDVTAAFKDLAGAEMAQIIRDHNAKKCQGQANDNNSTLEGQLALRAECLANVLATLLRSLRVFSP